MQSRLSADEFKACVDGAALQRKELKTLPKAERRALEGAVRLRTEMQMLELELRGSDVSALASAVERFEEERQPQPQPLSQAPPAKAPPAAAARGVPGTVGMGTGAAPSASIAGSAREGESHERATRALVRQLLHALQVERARSMRLERLLAEQAALLPPALALRRTASREDGSEGDGGSSTGGGSHGGDVLGGGGGGIALANGGGHHANGSEEDAWESSRAGERSPLAHSLLGLGGSFWPLSPLSSPLLPVHDGGALPSSSLRLRSGSRAGYVTSDAAGAIGESSCGGDPAPTDMDAAAGGAGSSVAAASRAGCGYAGVAEGGAWDGVRAAEPLALRESLRFASARSELEEPQSADSLGGSGVGGSSLGEGRTLHAPQLAQRQPGAHLRRPAAAQPDPGGSPGAAEALRVGFSSPLAARVLTSIESEVGALQQRTEEILTASLADGDGAAAAAGGGAAGGMDDTQLRAMGRVVERALNLSRDVAALRQLTRSSARRASLEQLGGLLRALEGYVASLRQEMRGSQSVRLEDAYEQQLATHRQIIDMPNDGNCLFHAVAEALRRRAACAPSAHGAAAGRAGPCAQGLGAGCSAAELRARCAARLRANGARFDEELRLAAAEAFALGGAGSGGDDGVSTAAQLRAALVAAHGADVDAQRLSAEQIARAYADVHGRDGVFGERLELLALSEEVGVPLALFYRAGAAHDGVGSGISASESAAEHCEVPTPAETFSGGKSTAGAPFQVGSADAPIELLCSLAKRHYRLLAPLQSGQSGAVPSTLPTASTMRKHSVHAPTEAARGRGQATLLTTLQATGPAAAPRQTEAADDVLPDPA